VPYLIDGDNLLGTWPDRARSEEQRRELAAELDRCSRAMARRVVVVFDGLRPPEQAPLLDVHYAGPGSDADSLLLTLLRCEREPHAWTVVTSDRALGDRCRYLGAAVERSDRFRKLLTRRTVAEL
jgi:predicted RNA-binding protein with PIN domain